MHENNKESILRYLRSCVVPLAVGLCLVLRSVMIRLRLWSRIFLMRFVIFSLRGNVRLEFTWTTHTFNYGHNLRLTRDQTCAQADPCRGVRGCTQGDLPEEEGQPQDSLQACHQDLVLHTYRGVRTCLKTRQDNVNMSGVIIRVKIQSRLWTC